MKQPITIELEKEAGKFCADGAIGLNFLKEKINPALSNNQSITLDFEGVRNMNSSFANAVFGNLIKQHGKKVLPQLTMVNVRENVKSQVIAGLSYGSKAP